MTQQVKAASRKHKPPRRAAVVVLFAMMLLVILAMVAFAVDIGHIMLVRTQLQVAADSASMAAASRLGKPYDEILASAKRLAEYHIAADSTVKLLPDDVEVGNWDSDRRVFTPSRSKVGNAVRVTAYRDAEHGGEIPLFFARALDVLSFSMKSSAVAMATPRDIAFVVDLSGSMNDDAEPCWATGAINQQFAGEGYPTVGSELMEKLFSDFHFGSYPGQLQYLGSPWNVPSGSKAYAELTKNGGPLTSQNVPAKYRISSNDSETTRKTKAYSAIIDYQLASVMPQAKPTPNSATNYAYWEKYLDYIIEPYNDQGSGSGRNRVPGRGQLPPNQDSDRVTGFNNPNTSTFPSASSSVPASYRNKLGYLTYVQFMVDHGRDMPVVGNQYSPLSAHSRDCPWHNEDTAGGTFSFPPREQPVHAARRALIAAMQVVRERNETIIDPDQRDWVSVISFDRLNDGGPVVRQSLTADYEEAMLSCTELQGVSDVGASTATDTGLLVAQQHIRPKSEGGFGREATNKVVVLLTDGVPNLYTSNASDVNRYIASHPDGDYYSSGSVPYNAPLVDAARMYAENWQVFPVGIGLGTDYDFMDRMSRLGGTANEDGQGARGSGNPAEYEERLAEIFREIITNPKVRLVQ